ncbi:MAG TPA: CDP-diacylglycerol--glycerol-3-phosphate 3-phosphatidyltransferase [Bryobacteraceae bacterium]|nr:CDP-diacylglycerol--glycerol-3-phosphate 3-phosphatidyltransferase [Bryobacteraceae bacterium]
MPRWLTLPNLFTLARLVLAPVVFREILVHRAFDALALFAAAAATDVIDGYLARLFGAVSASGAFLDPIADKLLLTGVYLALALEGSVPWWLAGVIFGRDLLILVASAVALATTRLRAFPPSVWGKASTFSQILAAVAFLGRNAFGSAFLATASELLIWPAAVLTVWSGIHYGWRGARLLRSN